MLCGIISIDLDGAVVFDGTISLHDRETMARRRVAGNLPVINAGKSVPALGHVMVPVGLEFDNAILYIGATVVDESTWVQCSVALPTGVVEDILDFVEGAPGAAVLTIGLGEDLLIYDTVGSGSELPILFRPATRRELDGHEVIGVPIRFTDPEMVVRTEIYLHRCREGQTVGFRNQGFIDVVPTSASKGEGLRRPVACLAESPAGETDRAAEEDAPGETPVSSSARFDVGPWTAEPVEIRFIGDSWNNIPICTVVDHSYTLPWSPSEVAAQCNGMVSSLANLIDSLMG